MSDDFNPYFKWLAIPPDEQPPNHYRLLGVPLFLDDPDVIEAAADQRMMLLRSYQAGARAALSQKLLNEVSNAKVCLLNAERKAEYDAQLNAENGSEIPLMEEIAEDSSSWHTTESEPSRLRSGFSIVAERYAWLGIPPKDWPPTDPQLLGLHPNVTAHEAVEAAVSARWKILAPYLDSSDSRIASTAESLIEEIKIAALNVRDEESEDSSTVRRAASASRRAVAPTDKIVQPGPMIHTGNATPTARIHGQRQQASLPPWATPVIGGAAVLVLVIILGSIIFSGSDRPNKPNSSSAANAGAVDIESTSPPTVATTPEPRLNVAESDFPNGEWVDVMPRIDPDIHAVAGDWQHRDGSLLVRKATLARIMVPVMATGDFDFEMTFDILGGVGQVDVWLPVGPRGCTIRVDTAQEHGGRCYLHRVDKVNAWDNPNAYRGRLTSIGRRQKYVVSVRRMANGTSSVDFQVNGMRAFRWQGNNSSLSPEMAWSIPEPRCLALCAYETMARFHSVRIRRMSGSIAEYVEQPEEGERPMDAKEFRGHYYKVYDVPRTRHEAQKKCTAAGGYLVRIESAEENRFLGSLFGDRDDAFWIDGSDEQSEGDWRYSDGTKVQYTNWDRGEPNDGGGVEHGILCANFRDWRWNDGNQGDRYLYICEWDGITTRATAEMDPTLAVPSDTVAHAGRRYKVFQIATTKHQADRDCRQMGGHLVRIESPDEAGFVYSLCKNGRFGSYWIDGSDAEMEGVWRFSNGQRMTFLLWNPGEPSNSGWGEHQMEIYSATGDAPGKMNDNRCDYRQGYICEWDE